MSADSRSSDWVDLFVSGLQKNKVVENLLYHSKLSGYVEGYSASRDFKNWLNSGRSGGLPTTIKHAIIRSTATKYRLTRLVETGTFRGRTVFAMRNEFRKIDSIEVDEALYEGAVRRFKSLGHVTIHLGDSAHVLPGLLAQLDEPTLFWLDGHYSGPGTGRGNEDSPVRRELQMLLDSPNADKYVLLIDDWRCFDGTGGYPTKDQVLATVREFRPNATIEIIGDVLVIGLAPPS